MLYLFELDEMTRLFVREYHDDHNVIETNQEILDVMKQSCSVYVMTFQDDFDFETLLYDLLYDRYSYQMSNGFSAIDCERIAILTQDEYTALIA